jgi:ABC-type lipoprotein export system ATPase subunit
MSFFKTTPMNTPLFTVSGLVCAYQKGHNVLKVKHLVIPRHKIVVLIGKSGSGKSTFLETLGLMNNTITEGNVQFHCGNGEQSVSFKQLWQKGFSEQLASTRRKHFSFIFQSTNLMPSFTAYENACLSQMIQGRSFANAMAKVKSVMEDLDLGHIPVEKHSVELSGGQRQRVAFIRAITPDFTVLFGDEPTGNLDEYNANELMTRLRYNIEKHN